MLVGVRIANFRSEFHSTSLAELKEDRDLAIQACITLSMRVHLTDCVRIVLAGCAYA